MAYGKPKSPRGASKKAAKQLNKMRKKVAPRQYGKPTEEKTKSGGTRGYVNVAKPEYPSYRPKKVKTVRKKKRMAKRK